jgi:hypothetical protein
VVGPHQRDAKIALVGGAAGVHRVGHGDHVGDTVEIAGETGAKVVTNYDLCMWLGSKRGCR